MNKKAIGGAGEMGAAAWLEARGYAIIDANVRPEGGMARGELDLVAWDGETLAFVEVKTRKTARSALGTPAEAIDARKRRQLAALALSYLAKFDLDDVPCRFDVVEVVQSPPSPPRFSLLRNAFDVSDTD